MPFLQFTQLKNNIFLGIWAINHNTENLDFFLEKFFLFENDKKYLETISNYDAKIRCLASRFCLKLLLEQLSLQYEGISHTENKKPFLKNLPNIQISISHSEDYCGAVVSFDKNIGLDLEKTQEKIQKIAPKFLSELEKNTFFSKNISENTPFDIDLLTQIWSSKEAMYKLYAEKKMTFKNDILVLNLGENAGKGRFFDKINNIWVDCDLHIFKWENTFVVISNDE